MVRQRDVRPSTQIQYCTGHATKAIDHSRGSKPLLLGEVRYMVWLGHIIPMPVRHRDDGILSPVLGALMHFAFFLFLATYICKLVHLFCRAEKTCALSQFRCSDCAFLFPYALLLLAVLLVCTPCLSPACIVHLYVCNLCQTLKRADERGAGGGWCVGGTGVCSKYTVAASCGRFFR